MGKLIQITDEKVAIQSNVIESLKMDDNYMERIIKNNEYNKAIVGYYNKLSYDKDRIKDSFKLLRKGKRLKECNQFWIMDKYEKQMIKDFKSTNLCRDKFCNNCKKVKQAQRMARFTPMLKPYKENMYQLTLTVPNCKGVYLKDSIKRMFKAFRRLIEYLKGKERNGISGIDFEQYGYKGAIRSLEITLKEKGYYHPHIHALIVLEPFKVEVLKSGSNFNKYSFDKYNKRDDRDFSDFEILIQKLWKLLYLEKTVSKENIDKMEIGYSCQLDKFKDDDFIELFKYMTKATSEKGNLMTYSQFKTLHNALDRVRQIQGYGCFYGLKDDDIISLDEIESAYDILIESLQKKELPVEIEETPQEALNSDYTIISRKKVGAYLRQLK